MQPRAFLGLLVLTLVAVAAAALVLLTQPGGGRVGGAERPAFPALAERPEAAAAIDIQGRDGTVRLRLGTDGAWSLPDKGAYPADLGSLRALLNAARALMLAETRTSDPARLPRLWLEDPAAPDAQSLRLTVSDASGARLADGVIGRTTNDLVAGQEGGTYLRYPEESQAWLAAGRLSLSPDPLDYLDRSIVTLPADTIRRVVITRPGGAVILAERAPGEPALALKTGLAEGQAAAPKALGQLANLLNGLTFNDVARADSLAFPADATHVTATSFDGIEVRLELAVIQGAPWVRLSAALAAEHTQDAQRLAGTQAFIDQLASKTTGWAYQLPQALADRLAPTPERLVSPP